MGFDIDRFLLMRSDDETEGADYDQVIQSLEATVRRLLGGPLGVPLSPIFSIEETDPDQYDRLKIRLALSFSRSPTLVAQRILNTLTADDQSLVTAHAVKQYVDNFTAGLSFDASFPGLTVAGSVTVGAGAPTPHWVITEAGSSEEQYGLSFSYVTLSGSCSVALYNTWDLQEYLTGVTFINTHIVDFPVGWSLLSAWRRFSAIENITLQGNSGLVMKGDIADIPDALVTLNLTQTASVITGKLSDLPADMEDLYLASTLSEIEGGNTPIIATGMKVFHFYNCGLTQAQVDSIVTRLYNDRDRFTDPNPLLNISGTDASPSSECQAMISVLQAAGWTIYFNP